MAGDIEMGTIVFGTTNFVADPRGGNFYVAENEPGGLTIIQYDWTYTGEGPRGSGFFYLLLSPDPIIDARDPNSNDYIIDSDVNRTTVSLDPFSETKQEVWWYGNALPFSRATTGSPRESMGDGTYYMAVQVISDNQLNSDLTNDLSNIVAVTFSGGGSGPDSGGSDTSNSEVRSVFADNAQTAHALSGAYHVLLGGVPNEAGFVSLINSAVSTNFGAGPGPVFNAENIFINLINNLVQGNSAAKARFDQIATGTTLEEKIASIYQALVPPSKQTAAGLDFLTSPSNIAFYQAVAAERGVAGTDGAAVVAMASLMKIVVDGNYGIGNSIKDLALAIAAGNDALPASGSSFTDIEVADGNAFDDDDAAAMAFTAARLAAPAPFVYIDPSSDGRICTMMGDCVVVTGLDAAATLAPAWA